MPSTHHQKHKIIGDSVLSAPQVVVSYAFAHLDDVSWGTKGLERMSAEDEKMSEDFKNFRRIWQFSWGASNVLFILACLYWNMSTDGAAGRQFLTYLFMVGFAINGSKLVLGMYAYVNPTLATQMSSTDWRQIVILRQQMIDLANQTSRVASDPRRSFLPLAKALAATKSSQLALAQRLVPSSAVPATLPGRRVGIAQPLHGAPAGDLHLCEKCI